MQCKACGTTDVIVGEMRAGTTPVHVQNKEKKGITLKTSKVEVSVCGNCGEILSTRLQNPEKLR